MSGRLVYIDFDVTIQHIFDSQCFQKIENLILKRRTFPFLTVTFVFFHISVPIF